MAGALAWVALNVSCDKMNDIHQKYFDEGERVHLAMPDSVTVYPGAGRVKISWFVNADPKVETTVIFWNTRQDSIEKAFTRIHDDIQEDSVFVDGLLEDAYVFELVNKNSRGERSLTTVVEGRSYGEKYERTLLNRSVNSTKFNEEQGSLDIEWNETNPTEVGVLLDYTDVQGVSRTMWVDNSETATSIPGFMAGEPLFCTTMHKPDSLAIDMFQAPKVQVPYFAGVTNLLTNTKAPFIGGNLLYSFYYEAVGWTANEAAYVCGNMDNYEGRGWLQLLAWDGYPASSMTNGKLYQTVELEAGLYRFETELIGYYGTPVAYAVAALGNDLPNVNDVAAQALASNPLSAGNISIEFTLAENSTVSLGYVASGSNIQICITNVELWKRF